MNWKKFNAEIRERNFLFDSLLEDLIIKHYNYIPFWVHDIITFKEEFNIPKDISDIDLLKTYWKELNLFYLKKIKSENEFSLDDSFSSPPEWTVTALTRENKKIDELIKYYEGGEQYG